MLFRRLAWIAALVRCVLDLWKPSQHIASPCNISLQGKPYSKLWNLHINGKKPIAGEHTLRHLCGFTVAWSGDRWHGDVEICWNDETEAEEREFAGSFRKDRCIGKSLKRYFEWKRSVWEGSHRGWHSAQTTYWHLEGGKWEARESRICSSCQSFCWQKRSCRSLQHLKFLLDRPQSSTKTTVNAMFLRWMLFIQTRLHRTGLRIPQSKLLGVSLKYLPVKSKLQRILFWYFFPFLFEHNKNACNKLQEFWSHHILQFRSLFGTSKA